MNEPGNGETNFVMADLAEKRKHKKKHFKKPLVTEGDLKAQGFGPNLTSAIQAKIRSAKNAK